ncbi:3'(2'),5'-bisphosphate nucleotidase CysQ [Luteirhabdus pelagi]|uniref:3'(2'),5'-bisphosphate nucleotidase CysQ n=1 Tax=Luteirhabdus pelagi TaxID=2792783 RepID=UPI0019397CE4|nr:3'(2'),5'-bisphosphate nucleotidase CysQ [Luteirhabdus pelagi]
MDISFLKLAVKSAISAGDDIMEVYGKDDFTIVEKDDNSPLTIADKMANDRIVSFLSETGIPIISEESKQTSYKERKGWTKCWIVDPLDGTKEFIKRNGEFTVNIALIENGQPKLGVIFVPVSKILYFTDHNSSASYKVEVKDAKETVSSIIERAEAIRPKRSQTTTTKIVGSRSHLNEETKAFVNDMAEKRAVEMVSIGSSLKFCLVAEGAADIYPRFAPTMEWDTAAGQAICEAVGVLVNTVPKNVPLQYNKENLLNPHFLVTVRN